MFCVFDIGMKNSPNCRRKAKIGGIDYQKYNDEETNFC